MEGTAVHERLNWRVCDLAAQVWETPSVRSLVLECRGWPGHLPGQHVDVRLTAEDGYQAERSYSLATPFRDDTITLTVQRLPDGEVSPYLCEVLAPGDQLELRGPIGGYFVWEPGDRSPVLLVGGGSGVVPLMAMMRERVAVDGGPPMRLLHSARSFEEIVYRDELGRIAAMGNGIEVFTTLTRARPQEWTGYARRVDMAMVCEVAWPAGLRPKAYVCGPTGFVEAVADILVDLGYPADRVLTERFGPTGV